MTAQASRTIRPVRTSASGSFRVSASSSVYATTTRDVPTLPSTQGDKEGQCAGL